MPIITITDFMLWSAACFFAGTTLVLVLWLRNATRAIHLHQRTVVSIDDTKAVDGEYVRVKLSANSNQE